MNDKSKPPVHSMGGFDSAYISVVIYRSSEKRDKKTIMFILKPVQDTTPVMCHDPLAVYCRVSLVKAAHTPAVH